MITVVQIIDNEGPTPATEQLKQGLVTTPAKPMTGDPIFALTTCATYAGPHATRTLTSKLGTQFKLIADLIGGQGNLNTDQELACWYAPVAIPGEDVFTQLFEGGDNDYQAFWAAQVSGLGALLLPAQGQAQGPVGPGNYCLNSGPPFEITAAMCPCVILIACQNISELGVNYTPSTAPGISHWGNWWKFAGEAKGLNNLCIGALSVTTPGKYQPVCNQPSSVAEYTQMIAAVFAVSTTATPGGGSTLTLSAADLATLNEGQPVTIQLMP